MLLAACERKAVTSSESVPEVGSEQPSLPPPVVMPEIALGPQSGTGVSGDESAKFEEWFLKYGIDSKNPAMLDADTDGDGFSNREEFPAGTNPLNGNSMPGMIEGLTMKELNDARVPMILREVKGGKARVERLDSRGVEELQEGSIPTGLPYRVTAVKHEVKADKHGVFSDVSQITMENSATKETVVLVRDLPSRSSETHAVLVGPGGVEQRVHVDEVITLPGQQDKKFKVLELRPDQVVVEELGSRQPLTIPKR
jgi:Bacterial TSP3 repeat